MKYKVLCTAPFKRFPRVMTHFKEVFNGDVIEYMEYDEILDVIHLYDGMIPNARIKVDSLLIDKANKLRAIYQPSMGYEHIDYKYCASKDILFNALGLDNIFKEKLWSTAEHTMSLILSLLKNNVHSVNNVKEKGKWDNREYRINDLRNLNVGVIGYGNIGKKVGYLCHCFGAKIAACDPYIKDDNFDDFVSKVSLNELLKNSDLVTIHVPANDETIYLIGESEVKLLNKNSYLINTSRGGIVNEAAIIESLKAGNISGVAFDVLENESPYGVSDQPLVNFSKGRDNVIITPHLGGSSYPYMEKIFLHSIDEIKSMLDNKKTGSD